jgi:hypothetical protein
MLYYMPIEISVSTREIYCVVLEIQNSVMVIDSVWTFFQAPLILEDALGFKVLVPSENDFDMLRVYYKTLVS